MCRITPQEIARHYVDAARFRVLWVLAVCFALVLLLLALLYPFALAWSWRQLDTETILLHPGGFVFGLMLSFFLFIGIIHFLRTLWVRRRPPRGVRVSRSEAPLLWAELDRCAAILEAPPIRELVMDDGSRLDVHPMWQIGPVASRHARLLLGVQALYLMDERDFVHVLLRDLLKCGKRPTKQFARYHFDLEMNSWYFGRLLEKIEARGRPTWVDKILFRSRERFAHASTDLILWQTWQRQILLGELVGQESALRSSLRIAVLRALGDERAGFASQLLRRFDTEPPADFLDRVIAHLQTDPPVPLVTVAYQQTLRPTAEDDAARFLSYLGMAEHFGVAVDSSDEAIAELVEEFIEDFRSKPRASARLLGDKAPGLLVRINEHVLKPIRRDWRKHQQVHQIEHGISTFIEEKVRKGEDLTQGDADMLMAVHQYRGNRTAQRQTLRDLVERFPGHGRYPFDLGLDLLAENDEEGLHFLKLAEDREFRCRPAAVMAKAEHALRMGDRARYDELSKASREMEPLCQAAIEERREMKPSSALEAHGIPVEVLQKVRTELAKLPWVRRIHIARVRTKYFTGQPWHAMTIEIRHLQWFTMTKKRREQYTRELQQILMTWIPGDYVWYFARDLRWASTRLRRVRDSLVYERQK